MVKTDCIRPGDWRDQYGITVDLLYEWGVWVTGESRERGMPKLGFPNTQPFAINSSNHYEESTLSEMVNHERAFETNRHIQLLENFEYTMLLDWYYGQRWSYVKMAETWSSIRAKEHKTKIDDKGVKEEIGRIVAMIDHSHRLVGQSRLAGG